MSLTADQSDALPLDVPAPVPDAAPNAAARDAEGDVAGKKAAKQNAAAIAAQNATQMADAPFAPVTPLDLFEVMIFDNSGGGECEIVSELYTPDFNPRKPHAETSGNYLLGGLGAWQAMCDRAALFAKQSYCAAAFVRRESDGKMWRVSGEGLIEEMKDTVKL